MFPFWNRKPAEEKVDEQAPPVPVEKSESEKAFDRLRKLGGGKSTTFTFGNLKNGAATQIHATKSSMGDALASIEVNYLLDGKHLYTACTDFRVGFFGKKHVSPGIGSMRFTETKDPAGHLKSFTQSVERKHEEWSFTCLLGKGGKALELWHRGLSQGHSWSDIRRYDGYPDYGTGSSHRAKVNLEKAGGVVMSDEYYKKTGGKRQLEADLKQQQAEREREQMKRHEKGEARKAALNSLPKLAAAGFNVNPNAKESKSTGKPKSANTIDPNFLPLG